MVRPHRLHPSNRAIAAIAIVVAVLINGVFCFWLVQSNVSAIEAQRHAFRAHNLMVQARLCRTFESLAADKPPTAGSAKDLSRLYLQELHERLGDVPSELGCSSGG